ncbi:MAG: aminoglycoside phosphotransferase family protein [Anaerolineae bacterium]|jgi:aminoglycoside phosphotransferase (APT) family kinase protein|nr:aminoglycoside phosphotransferase family protein [Anaerolineae bacterium]MDH7475260.1 aminoglycoside phosphotransferase family protein [Anaerolineae bacterium]
MMRPTELPAEIINAIVHRAFPAAQVEKCDPFPGEHRNLNYDLVLSNPTMEIVLRVYWQEGPGSRKPQKESHVLRIVTPETGVPVPRLLLFDDSGTLTPQPVALHTRLPGSPLTIALTQMDKEAQETVGYELGRYLAKLHSIPLGCFGEFFDEDPLNDVSEKAYTLRRVQSWLDICAERELLTSGTRTQVEEVFVETRYLSRPVACFVHGDLRAGHVLVEPGAGAYHVTGLVDFQESRGWGLEWDVARLAHEVFDGHPLLEKGFLDGYADTAGLPADFWERLHVYRLAVALYNLAKAEAEEIESQQEALLRLLGEASN